jgi:TP901 family phage tail tape measure protein
MARGANGGEVRARLTLDNSQFKKNMKDSREEMSELDKNAQKNQESFRQLEKAATITGLAVAGIIAASVATSAQFEQGMARVAAISGATGSELERLENAAKDAGASTVFSANQATDALGFLAMAGFGVTQQVETLPHVLNLAAAAQMDLGSSADIVTNIMTGFGIEAEDSGMAVDVLVQAMTTANTDLHQLGEAMKFVAPVASSLGWSLEETATAVAKMSDAGIQGSQAGTSLRAMLLALSDPTGKAKDVIEDLNLELYDANDNLLPLPDLVREVAGGLEGMSETQQTAAASALVGREAASGFLSVIKESPEELEKYIKSLEESEGRAEQLAAVQNDTLIGSFNQFKSVLEAVAIELGEEFTPELREIVDVGTDVLNWILNINPKILEMSLKFAGGAAAAVLAVGAFNKLRGAIKLLQLAMGPMGWLALAAGLLGGIAAASWDATEATEGYTEVNLDQARQLAETSGSLDTMITRYEELSGKSKLSNDEFARYIDIAKQLQYETNASQIEKLKDEQEKLATKSGVTNDELLEMVGLNQDIIDIAPHSVEAITAGGEAFIDTAGKAREYNDELREQLRLELETQRSNAVKNLASDYEELTEALKEQQSLGEDIRDNKREQANELDRLVVEQAKLEMMEENIHEHSSGALAAQKEKVEQAELNHGWAVREGEELNDNVLEQQKIVNEKRLAVMEGQNAVNTLIDFYLTQIEVTAEKGKEIEAIETAIEKLEEQKQKIMENVGEGGKLTEEQREQIDAIGEQISQHEIAKGKVKELQEDQKDFTQAIEESTGEMIDLNFEAEKEIVKWLEADGWLLEDAEDLTAEAEKGVTKEVSLFETGLLDIETDAKANVKKPVDVYQRGLSDLETRIASPISKLIQLRYSGNKPSGLRHMGGPVYDLPKYHNGGNVKKPQEQLNDTLRNLGAPNHNEVDVRLLRNEMVLTQAQQSNLFRMVDTFGTMQAQRLKELSEVDKDDDGGRSVIHVNSLVVREEADVRRIAEELDRLDKYKKRSKGGR